MFVHSNNFLIGSVYFNVLLQSVITLNCESKTYDRVFEPCGYCGVCRRQLTSKRIGVCDKHYLTTADKLFRNDSRSDCVLRDYCEQNPKVCQGDDDRFTRVCYPLYGTYQCQCHAQFFGQNCEYKVDDRDRPKLGLENSNFLYASINNIVFTPMFYTSDHAIIYISLLEKGLNLEIHFDNGRGEQLIYDGKKCESGFKKAALSKFCKRLYNEFQNVYTCLGIVHDNKKLLMSDSCLIILHVPYPRANYDSGQLIYETIGANSSNSPVLGKVETAMVTIYNRFGTSLREPVFKRTFSMINVYNSLGFKNKCIPQPKLINCGSTMNNMPQISRYGDTVILSSVEVNNFNSTCKTLEKVMMKWQLWRIEKNHDELRDVPVEELFNKNSYLIAEDSLYYGVYKFKLTTTAVFKQDVVPGVGYCFIEVVPIPIQTVILGGSTRYLYYKQNINFEVLTKTIPDKNIPNKSLKIMYQWQCDDVKESFCSLFETSETCRLIPGPFTPSKTYHFTLNVKSTEMYPSNQESIAQPSANQVVVISNVNEPEIVINCLLNCGGTVFKANPQEIIHLEFTFNRLLISKFEAELNLGNNSYYWKYSHVGVGQSQDLDEIREKDTPKNVLIVKKNMLLENNKYSFEVTGTGGGRPKYAKLVIETCKLPKNVSCTIFPHSGVKGETFFNINCSYHKNEQDFTSVTYEFYDRYFNDRIGRYLGFSETGILEKFLLTRNKLYIRATNFLGAFFETNINVNLSAPTQALTVSQLNFGHKQVDNYIYRMGIISAYGDLLATKHVTFNAIDILLEKLGEEKVEEITGAILLENVLYNLVCKIPPSSGVGSKSVFNMGKVMNDASFILKETATTAYENSRLMTTTRMLDITESLLNCSSVVLGIIHNTKYTFVDANAHNNFKVGTYYTMNTLNYMISTLAFQVLPSVNRIKLVSLNIKVVVKDFKSIYVEDDELIKTVNISETLLRKTSGRYIYTITFTNNPFWWSNGDKINTNVIDEKMYYITKYIEHTTLTEMNNELHFNLSVMNFEPLLVSGFVKQPDPNGSPEINDFVVAVHRIDPEQTSVSFIRFSGMKNDTSLRVVILQDQRPDYDYMVHKSKVITKNSPKLKFNVEEVNKDSLFYVGILPGLGIKVGDTVDYSFELYSASCKVWKYEAWMTGSRCNVGESSNKKHLICSCTLLTVIIGGYMYIPPTKFNPFSDVPLLITIRDYPFFIVFLLIILSLYVLLMLWVKEKDKNDDNKINIIVLEDNYPGDSFGYLVAVFTGLRVSAGTTSSVGIMLIGDEGVSRRHILRSSLRPTLKANSDDWFLIFTPYHLGLLIEVELWLTYSGEGPNWYCSKLFVCDLDKYETDTFIVEKWFGLTMNNIRLHLVTEYASYEETNQISRIIFENIVYGFRDIHLWFSVFFRHPRSLVRRTQRLTVAVCGLFVAMFSSIILYSSTTPQLEDFAFYNITKETFIIGMTSSLLGSLVSLFTMKYFKSAYTFTSSPPNFHEHRVSHDMYNFQRQISKDVYPNWLNSLWRNYKYIKLSKAIPVQSNEDILVGVKLNKRKVGFAWLLCFIVIFTCSHIIFVCSLDFGKFKILLWLTSLVISVIQTVFITVPVRIILTASLLGITKTCYFQLMSHNIGINRLLENLHLKMSDEFDQYLNKKRELQMYKPAEMCEMWKLNTAHSTFIAASTFLYTIGCFTFLGSVLWLIYEFNVDQYYLTNETICNEMEMKDVCKTTHRTKLGSMEQFLENLEKHFLPLLHFTKWYNNDNLTLPQESFQTTGWMKDGMSRLVGNPRLRQIRVKNYDSCQISKIISNFSSVCLLPLSPETEDRGKYSTGWSSDNWTDTLFDMSPWVFTDPTEARSPSVRAPSGYVCQGGGYIVSLQRSLNEGKRVIRNLIDTHWIDKYTRIVITEFTTVNSNNNIFTSAMFITEALPVGTVITEFTILSIKLSNIPPSGLFFILYLVFFIIRVLLLINVMGVGTYCKNLWNIYDVIIAVFYIAATIYYVQYILQIEEYREKLRRQGKYMLFYTDILTAHFVSTRDAVGILFCLVAFRMLRIIRFNSDVRQYIHDLCAASTEIFCTWIFLVTCMFIQFRLIMFLIVAPVVDSFIHVLVFRTEFHTSIYNYSDATGKLLAYLLSLTSQIGTFSYLISLAHYHRNRPGKRLTAPLPRRTQFPRLWQSAYD